MVGGHREGDDETKETSPRAAAGSAASASLARTYTDYEVHVVRSTGEGQRGRGERGRGERGRGRVVCTHG